MNFGVYGWFLFEQEGTEVTETRLLSYLRSRL
jgi:hypothetical protein